MEITPRGGHTTDARSELARLLTLIEAYSKSIEELQALNDPAVAGLIAKTIALRERAAEEVEHLTRIVQHGGDRAA